MLNKKRKSQYYISRHASDSPVKNTYTWKTSEPRKLQQRLFPGNVSWEENVSD